MWCPNSAKDPRVPVVNCYIYGTSLSNLGSRVLAHFVLCRQVMWYLNGIFRGEPHPYHAAPAKKFNPLQHLTYVCVMYVMYPLLLVSGVALLFPNGMPEGFLGRPGVFGGLPHSTGSSPPVQSCS